MSRSRAPSSHDLRAEGEAEADSIRVKGAAEALEERATDFLRQQIITLLPEIVRAASEPLSAISNMTVISSDGNGTSQVGQNVANQLATSTQIIKDLVGIDLRPDHGPRDRGRRRAGPRGVVEGGGA